MREAAAELERVNALDAESRERHEREQAEIREAERIRQEQEAERVRLEQEAAAEAERLRLMSYKTWSLIPVEYSEAMQICKRAKKKFNF